MQKVSCARCNTEMVELWTAPVFGHHTLRFHCFKCGGVANVQLNGNKARQIQLDGNHNEYRPNAIKPLDNVELEHPSAFTLGTRVSPLEQQARAAAYAAQQAAQRQQFAMAQAQAMQQARAVAIQQNQAVAAHNAYLEYVRQQQARGFRAPAPVQQPVAYTLGQHAAPVLPLSAAELRRKIMGR